MLSQVISTFTDEIILYFLANRDRMEPSKQEGFLTLIGKMVGFSLQLDSMQGLGRKSNGPHVCGRSFEDLIAHLEKVYGLRIHLEEGSLKPLKWGTMNADAITDKYIANTQALEQILQEFEVALKSHTDAQTSSYPSIIVHQIQEMLSDLKALC